MPSNCFSRLKSVVGRSVFAKASGVYDSVEVFVGRGKFLFGDSRLFHSASSDAPVVLHPETVFNTNSELINQRTGVSFVGTLSRACSTPSVSGPPFQVCGYHIDRALGEPAQISIRGDYQILKMPVSLSSAVVSECQTNFLVSRGIHHSLSGNGVTDLWIKKVSKKSNGISMSFSSPQQPDNKGIYSYFLYNGTKNWDSAYKFKSSGSGDFLRSLFTCSATGPAPHVSFDTSVGGEQLADSADAPDLKNPSGKTLKLISGSCYLPHPDKEETGGEDAHFICVDEQAIGVADGVGGWAELDIDSGQYSRELMANSVNAIKEEPRGSVDPARVLEKAHSQTKAMGSSTACIIALTDQGLRAINLGDSGFMVVRDGCSIFRSNPQQHGFNFTYQLENGSNGDLPSSGEVSTVAVEPGDVVIAGTDGLFDNLYPNEITAVVVHAMRAGLGPQVTAQKLAALARQRAQDKDRQTPFSTAAQDAGYRYYGGKLDDTTVVVSYITSVNDA